jgi:putative tryptophan/tyrosine transport system substrate-binding protein
MASLSMKVVKDSSPRAAPSVRRRVLAVGLALIGARYVHGAQQPEKSLPKVGEIWFSEKEAARPYHAAFHQGLGELGYVQGKNIDVVTRYANNDESKIADILADLLGLGVSVLFVSQKAVRPAMRATSVVPIVCATWEDPVGEGYVVSLARPGGNVTGVSWQGIDTMPKQLELVRELVPRAKRLALLLDPEYKGAVLRAAAMRRQAKDLGFETNIYQGRTIEELRDSMQALGRNRFDALIFVDSALTSTYREELARLAVKAKLATFAEDAAFAESGTLATYGASLTSALKRGAAYVDKILKGARPEALPIEQPTQFELVLNLKTANSLHLKIPKPLLERADRLIQ